MLTITKRKAFLIPVILLLLCMSAVYSYAETINYAYDDVNRLLTESHDDGTIISYSYDEVGNRTRKVITRPILITASSGSGGSIYPSGSIAIAAGSSRSFDIIPKSPYYIADVTVDGISVGPVSSYTFSDIITSHSIDARFMDGTPDTLLLSRPNNPASTNSAEFVFTSTVSGSTFECRLDAGDWMQCLSQVFYRELTPGGHSFSVRAIGPTGIMDVTPASYSWLIDIMPPVLVQISSVPSPTKNQMPSYTFSSNEAGLISYGGNCASLTTSAVAGDNPIVLSGPGNLNLTDGTYHDCTITVTDAAGNCSAPLMISAFIIDTAPPSDGALFAAPENGQVALSWTPASDNGSGLKTANTYKLVRNARTVSTIPNIPDVRCANGAEIYNGTALAFTDTGLTNDTTYDYRLCAYDNAANISAGSTASAFPVAQQGHMARNSYHLTPEGWLVMAYTEGSRPYTVKLAVLDPSAQPVPADQIQGLAANPLLITATANKPGITLIFDDSSRTAYIIHDVSGVEMLTVIPNIELKPASAPVLEAPSAVNFGTVKTGTFIDIPVAMSNTGAADLHVSSITAPSSPFSSVSDNCITSAVAPTGACNITIRFSPATKTSYTGSFTINSDGGNKTVLLQGAGGQK
ncbi:MAG: hypothetical protein HZB33_00560 [Nitrospirae bacterium]|nr:hypothetical protein [Nitrospirota bacterium]